MLEEKSVHRTLDWSFSSSFFKNSINYFAIRQQRAIPSHFILRRVSHPNLNFSVRFGISSTTEPSRHRIYTLPNLGWEAQRRLLRRASWHLPLLQEPHPGTLKERWEMQTLIPKEFSGPEHVSRLEISMTAIVEEAFSCSSTKTLHPAQLACLCMFGCGLHSYILSSPLANIYYI